MHDPRATGQMLRNDRRRRATARRVVARTGGSEEQQRQQQSSSSSSSNSISSSNRSNSSSSSNGGSSGGSSWSVLIRASGTVVHRRAEPMRWMRNDGNGTMAGGACTEAAHETLVEAVINNKTLRLAEGL